MPLGPDVHYLSDVITKQQKIVDDMFWEDDDWLRACAEEKHLKHLMMLMDRGEVYYCDF